MPRLELGCHRACYCEIKFKICEAEPSVYLADLNAEVGFTRKIRGADAQQVEAHIIASGGVCNRINDVDIPDKIEKVDIRLSGVSSGK